jgi:AraC family transcriptional activator of pyochelin receptor
MAFVLKDTQAHNFTQLSNFFREGFNRRQLLEQEYEINHPFATGYSHDWYFDGIRMGYSDLQYDKHVDLQWKYKIDVELITFQANLKGSVFISTGPGRAFEIFGSYQNNLSYSHANQVSEGVLRSEDLRSSIFFIQFTKEAFLRLTADGNEALNRFCNQIINGRPAFLSNGNLAVDATMVNLINSILNCAYKDGLKKMFLLSKSLELLVLQAEACNTKLLPHYQYIKTKYDHERILYAREYVMSRLETPPGLSELAKIVGINEYKLKRGFKEVFGTTVFGYLSDARLEIARNELMENKKPVYEIASDLGYSSVQHFSNAFKKKFGVPPGKIRP